MAGQALSSSPNQRTAGILLGFSYLLLVLVIAFGAYWVQNQFEQARTERCDLLVIQIRLAQLETVILQASDPPPAAAAQDEIDARVDTIRERVEMACPNTDLP